ncbi:MAG: crossover junction endodeoxyribonuclease RuvC [Acetobacterales bacterium]
MRVLGLDPGLRNTGWGVLDIRGNRISHVADGVVRSDSSLQMPDRLVQLHAGLAQVIATYRPDHAAVEETYVNKNPDTTLRLGQARGVVLLTPAEAGVAVFEYGAMQIKKAVVGYGHAQKAQVAMMVRTLLPGAHLDSPDAADALATALCHAHHVQTAASRGLAGELRAAR